MQELQGFDLVIGLVALTIAVWGQMVSAAVDRLEDLGPDEAPERTYIAAFVGVGGVVLVLSLIIAMGAALGTAGTFGKILLYLLFGSIFLSLPHVLSLVDIIYSDLDDITQRQQWTVLGVAGFAAAIILLLWLV